MEKKFGGAFEIIQVIMRQNDNIIALLTSIYQKQGKVNVEERRS